MLELFQAQFQRIKGVEDEDSKANVGKAMSIFNKEMEGKERITQNVVNAAAQKAYNEVSGTNSFTGANKGGERMDAWIEKYGKVLMQ